MTEPYRSTPVFDESSLPAALRRDHSTKAGVWGVIRVLEGRLRLERSGGQSSLLGPEAPGLVSPGEVHRVEPLGPIRMQVDFYTSPPDLEAAP
jgi:tellurite resistance-related uncharacterized protein